MVLAHLPNLLLVAHVDFIFEFLLCAPVSVYALVDQDGLYRGVSENDAGGEEAVDNGKEDLNCTQLASMLNGYFLYTYAFVSISAPHMRQW
mgnify:CR=1 FL=1|tara:strand:- start:1179 stop:1451 length:273 start_codon:yes stop_codon:yes gene_type:complete